MGSLFRKLQIKMIRQWWFMAVFGYALTSCSANKTLSLSSGYKGEVIALEFGTDGKLQERKLGELPIDIDLEEYQGQGFKIRFESDGSEQVWVISDLLADQTSLNLTPASLNPSTVSAKGGSQIVHQLVAKKEVNMVMRLILKAYQALSSDQLDSAIALADQALKEQNGIAAPHIIKGLAYLQANERTKAITEFNLAKNYDPEDADLQLILRSLEEN